MERRRQDLKLLEVELKSPEDFLRIAETLTRIGIPSKLYGKNVLFQSCHILHKRGAYYIVSFKELFCLDGRETDISEEDIARRNAVASLLDDWGLCEMVLGKEDLPMIPKNRIKIIKHSEKSDWELRPKYRIGNRN